jgi:hypothetical protein
LTEYKRKSREECNGPAQEKSQKFEVGAQKGDLFNRNIRVKVWLACTLFTIACKVFSVNIAFPTDASIVNSPDIRLRKDTRRERRAVPGCRRDLICKVRDRIRSICPA